MAGVNKLTAVQIKNASPGKMSDGGGLILNKTANGGKWIYRYSFGGRRREMGLGSFPEVSLADARKARTHWQQQLLQGLDPISERQRITNEQIAEINKTDPTFKECAETVFEGRKAQLRGDGERGRWLSPIKIHLFPKIGHIRMSQVHQSDIHKALRPIWKTKHETANKALYRTRLIFEKARLTGQEVDPFTVDAARELLGHFDATVTPIAATDWRDIPSLYERLNKHTMAHLSLRWIILTAVRGDGARGARFDEIDGDIWTVPADRMKGRRGQVKAFRVPLSDAAMEIVETCREVAWTDYLFPSVRKGCITVQAQIKILNKMGEQGRPHGFRTSFRSWVQDTEAASYDVAETALAHVVGSKVERSYARSDLIDKRRILMQKWADYVTGNEAKVVPIRGSK